MAAVSIPQGGDITWFDLIRFLGGMSFFAGALLYLVCKGSVLRRRWELRRAGRLAVGALRWSGLDPHNRDIYRGRLRDVEVDARNGQPGGASSSLTLGGPCRCGTSVRASSSVFDPAALQLERVPLTPAWPAGWSAAGAPRWDASALASVLRLPDGGRNWRSLRLEDRRLEVEIELERDGLGEDRLDRRVREFEELRGAIEVWSGESRA